MHCLDLGVYESVAATCLEELVQEKVWGDNKHEESYTIAHGEYKAWCSKHGLPPAPRFERSKLAKANEFPRFTQQSAKASATRYLVLWLAEVCGRPGMARDEHSARRLEMMEAFVTFEDTCDKKGRWLSAEDSAILADSMQTALTHMNSLFMEAKAAGKLLWHLQPKCHMATHLAYDFAATRVNPRRTTCYADEDMVGRCKKIILKCHGKSAGRSLVLRYCILVSTRWWTMLQRLRGIRA